MGTLMKALVFNGPYNVSVENRLVPSIRAPTDIIVKVSYAAICGSDLHVYRGHQESPTGFIMGHEFTGTVIEAGDEVHSVNLGDKVVCPFTVSCMSCFFCKNGCSSRCEHCAVFGSAALDGAQAQFVRVPFADGTVIKSPSGVEDRALVLMADIFPTGFFGTRNAFRNLTPKQINVATVVVLGCGPVGLCALIAAAKYQPAHLIAVDNVPSRIERAKSLGATTFNFATDGEALDRMIKGVTGGRGADAVIEVVGSSSALRMAFDLIRPWGTISSIGVHNGEVPWTAKEAYQKNLMLQTGRCPVRSIFQDALSLLLEKQNLLDFMFDHIIPISSAKEGYDAFDKMQVQKVIFNF